MNTFYNFSPEINVKNINKHAALSLIRFTPGGVSRVQLARRMNLTRAAITSIVNDLMEAGAIREAESRSSKQGRPQIMLEINPNRGVVAGIDMGFSHISIVITNFIANVIVEHEDPFNITDGPEKCIARADELLRELLAKADLDTRDLLAIGVGVPGPIDTESGAVITPPIMPGWDRFPIHKNLEKKWKRTISLNNDAELGALGEWAYGAGRNVQNLAYIKVGSGIGAGLLINGNIYRGATGSAGEIGHMTLEENGPVCSCGNQGCLEALSGGKAISEQAREAALSGLRTQLSSIQPVDRITAMDVAMAASRGDLISQQILARAGKHLGIALASLVNLFNPDMIVVGGGVAQIGDLFLEPVREVVQKRSLPASAHKVRITTALLGRRSASMGATVQALNIASYNIAEGQEVPAK